MNNSAITPKIERVTIAGNTTGTLPLPEADTFSRKVLDAIADVLSAGVSSSAAYQLSLNRSTDRSGFKLTFPASYQGYVKLTVSIQNHVDSVVGFGANAYNHALNLMRLQPFYEEDAGIKLIEDKDVHAQTTLLLPAPPALIVTGKQRGSE